MLIADEPTANLDSDPSEDPIKLFRHFNREIGQTIIMVTHGLEGGKKATRIIWVKDGDVDHKNM